MSHQDITQLAVSYARKHKASIAQQVCSLEFYPKVDRPMSLFMAGSPGAGKTELSKRLIDILQSEMEASIVRLDTDELRSMIPYYDGTNSHQVQDAATILFDRCFDQTHRNQQHALYDTTFSSPKAISNVARALNRDRKVLLMYIHLDPQIAWEITQKRRVVEGRFVPKEVFINSYFKSRENVSEVIRLYGSRIVVMVSDRSNATHFKTKRGTLAEVSSDLLEVPYSRRELEKMLSDDL